ncbi:MAG TPA: CusA/CzcA family heavy metal efflux RND transporter [Bacteroidota bacterium]|nr:CusA/CzcA family heavy metal efflux RND transporter [Bacteroidota bacterium]
MIEKIIEYSARNRFVIILIYAVLIGWGIWSLVHTPVDAIPDLSDNQVIVFTQWMGRSPRIIEDQVTYPLVSNLQGLPRVKSVRAQSMYGMSFIYIIFDDDVDIYWARSRVLEKLNYASSSLPPGVTPTLGPDGTGVGHVFWYTVEGRGYDLGELRAIQDWYVRYQLNSVPGVAEVASVGGFVKQFQVDVDPRRLASYNVSYDDVVRAIKSTNREVGGKTIESNNIQFFVRGRGYLHSIREIENIPVRTGTNGVPILVKNLGTVQMGNDLRLGLLDKNGTGEVAGGIVVMRFGENAKDVISRVKEKIAEIEKGLPPGVTILPAYDRSDLIERSIDTLTHALAEEGIVVSLVVMIFILHLRSALRIIIEIPVSVLMAFILMKQFGITSNIMSLGGIAIAIGVLVDSSIVLVENCYRAIAHAQESGGPIDYTAISIRSAQQVGRAIFFSLLIIIVSFLPVFLLEGQEGRLFHPLAWTKTFALASSAIISITLVPMLMTMLMRGKFRPEEKNPVSRVLSAAYSSLLTKALKYRKTTLAINVLALLITIPMILHIGSEFMPALDEGSLLFMPVTLPNVSIEEAKRILQVQDKIISDFPEVQQVLGKVGRAETSTDPAPISMTESIILLKPRSEWRHGITTNDIVSQLDQRLQIPGVRNGWTQPIINRINMLSTGVRTDLGVKILGGDIDTLEHLAIDAEGVLKSIPGAADVYADRVTQGEFIDIDVNTDAVARYGINAGDVLNAVESGIGGENISTIIEGRQRFPIRVRFAKDDRDNVDALRRLLIPVPLIAGGIQPATTSTGSGSMIAGSGMDLGMPSTSSGHAYIPLGQLADIRQTPGPSMLNSENGLLRSAVFLNVRGRDMGSFVDEAKDLLTKKLPLPPGYYVAWSGQYENQMRAKSRLEIVLPIVFVIIFIMLYFTLRSAVEAAMVMLSVPFALIGGVCLIYFLGYNFSVAVWVGFIALYGIAVETGIVMVIYLHEALDRRLSKGSVTERDITASTVEGAVLRLRPKVMTVATNLLGLLPIMFSTGTGSDVMKPLAAPMVGGIVTSAIHVLFVTPIIFSLMKEHALKKGTLRPFGTKEI